MRKLAASNASIDRILAGCVAIFLTSLCYARIGQPRDHCPLRCGTQLPRCCY